MRSERKYADHPVVAVGGVVIREGRVLLARRGGEPSAGTWSIPGGVLEKSETLREGVVRELREETGLEVEVTELIDAAERIFNDDATSGPGEPTTPQYHYVILDYLCAVQGGTAAAGSDATEVAWVREADLAEFDLTADVTRILQKAFRMAATRTY